MERIGEYLVRRLVGEGGMGKVFEAEERLSKRRVALKVLRPELSRSDEARRLFLNEMTILAHLDHPNVVRCLACSEVDGELVMALEYLQGQTLREVLTQYGRMDWTQAVGVAGQIAAALRAAHGQTPPIIHRDLKPENVIMLPGGEIKVMDFGIAKVLEALNRSTTHSVGTLQYMSPEQIDATGVDARSDLYCLGLTLYELLTGRPPFASPSPRELLNLQCTAEPPELPPEIRAVLPKGIERLVFSLLAKNPSDRPDSAQAVLDALEPFAVADGFRHQTLPGGVQAADPEAPVILRGNTEPAPGQTVPARGGTAPLRGGTLPMGPAVARRPVNGQDNDTIGIIEQATAPRMISTGWGVAFVLIASLLAGGLTYAAKLGLADEGEASDSAGAPVEALR